MDQLPPHPQIAYIAVTYCLFISVQINQDAKETNTGLVIPSFTLTKDIIKTYFESIIHRIIQIVILSTMDCIIFKDRRSHCEGMNYEESVTG